MRISIWAASWVLAAGSMSMTQAAAPAPPSRLGLCAACHGTQGHARIPGVPDLAGQRLDYLQDALRQYRDGRRNVPVMRTAVGPLSETELDALATWYSEQIPSARTRP
jgi:cytochrome c553